MLKLTADQNNQRLELYRQGLTDKKIADIIGINKSNVWAWRKLNGLPTHNKRGRYKRMVGSGVPMKTVLPPGGCRLVKTFFRDLIWYAGKTEKEIDFNAFLRKWIDIKGGEV